MLIPVSLMINFDRYGIPVAYKGLQGLSETGFKKQGISLGDLFPTADEIVLSMKAYFQKLGECASIIYEVSRTRFDVVHDDRTVELAMQNPKGDYIGVIIDVLGIDMRNARIMMEDIEETCGFVRARLSDALRIMEMSEEDYLQRLRDSMRLLAHELCK